MALLWPCPRIMNLITYTIKRNTLTVLQAGFSQIASDSHNPAVNAIALHCKRPAKQCPNVCTLGPSNVMIYLGFWAFQPGLDLASTPCFIVIFCANTLGIAVKEASWFF